MILISMLDYLLGSNRDEVRATDVHETSFSAGSQSNGDNIVDSVAYFCPL